MGPTDDRGESDPLRRPEVDPSIKGIPQGWEDDPSIPVAPNPPLSLLLRQPTVPQTSRLTSLRDGTARVKLTSLTHKVRDVRERSSFKTVQLGSETVKHSPLPNRTSSLFTYNPSPFFRPHAASQQLDHKDPGSGHHAVQTSNASALSHDSPIEIISTRSNTSISVPDISLDSHTPTNTYTDLATPFTSPSVVLKHVGDQSSISSGPAPSTRSATSSNRERVMGLRKDPVIAHGGPEGRTRTYGVPDKADVLPFGTGSPYTAWSTPTHPIQGHHINSTAQHDLASMTRSGTSQSGARNGWKDLSISSVDAGKRVWIEDGQQIGGIYKVGWERTVLDLEGRLHETMYDILGGKHTLVAPQSAVETSKTVLDIGTGLGLWPISQALEWPEAHFVGLDLVPCQTDLSRLAKAERKARSTSSGSASGLGMWESVAQRISWDRASFLDTLPYDTGVFDMVHVRFVGLGVPESKWGDLLEDATRVLKRGGKLEIVETSYTLPSLSPTSLQNSFASLLLSDFVSPQTSLPIQFNLPILPSLVSSSLNPVFSKMYTTDIPGALADAVSVWVKSSLDYKGTSLSKGRQGELDGGLGRRVKDELIKAAPSRWAFAKGAENGSAGETAGTQTLDIVESKDGVNVWVWVVSKK